MEDEDILEKLLTKLIGLTEFGALRWHFAGDVSKAYVTVYKDSRLKLTTQALDITEVEKDTVRIDARLHSKRLYKLLINLHRAARESSGRFRTGQIEATPSSLMGACQKLLEDEEQILMVACLACANPFDPAKAIDHLSEKVTADKSIYICPDCVAKLGVAAAQVRLNNACREAMVAESSADMDETTDDEINDDMGETTNEAINEEYHTAPIALEATQANPPIKNTVITDSLSDVLNVSPEQTTPSVKSDPNKP